MTGSARDPGSFPAKGRPFLPSHNLQRNWGPSSSPSEWEQGVERPERKANRSAPINIEIENTWGEQYLHYPLSSTWLRAELRAETLCFYFTVSL
jgi:hypothetical protein